MGLDVDSSLLDKFAEFSSFFETHFSRLVELDSLRLGQGQAKITNSQNNEEAQAENK